MNLNKILKVSNKKVLKTMKNIDFSNTDRKLTELIVSCRADLMPLDKCKLEKYEAKCFCIHYSSINDVPGEARAKNCIFKKHQDNVDYIDVIQWLGNGWLFHGSKRRFVKQISRKF